nr:hypothetical protein [Stenotrophomonas maltophilia]
MRVRPGGDMEVLSLAAAAAQPVAVRGEHRAMSAAREDVWIAFSNPDPQRLRYFNRKTGAVKHFQQTDLGAAVGLTPVADWVKIEPVPGTQQTAWMQEFLAQASTLVAADYPMIAQPYRTAVNVEFTKALGAAGKQWTQFRTGKMFEVMSQWAQRAGVDVSMLLPSFETRHAHPPVSTASLTDAAALSPKQRALKLIESLTDQEIADTLIPLMASIIMVSARR